MTVRPVDRLVRLFHKSICYDEAMENAAIKINGLSVTLGGKVKALDDISLDLPAGKIVGFIGPSGAGKTTLIRCLVGRLAFEGEIVIFGQRAGSPQLRKTINYMAQSLSVYPDLTVKENLNYFATMAGLRKHRKTVVADVLKAVDMKNKADSLVSDLSGGQKQRVSLAIALIGEPKLMILDEPTVGLDPVLREQLWALFAQIVGKGTSLIVSSHSMDEAGRCDDLVLIRGGKVIAHDSPAGLLKQTASQSVEDSFLKLVGGKQ